MPKPPDKPKKPRDYARPTRAKASRPDAPPAEPALDRLLNPGIEKGTAGMGSGTGLRLPNPSFRGASEASEPGIQKQTPSKHLDSGPAPEPVIGPAREGRTRWARPGMTSESGLQPPPDNSFDRRADFSAAHRARKSTPKNITKDIKPGFGERPQAGYHAPHRAVSPALDINAELRKALGYGQGDPNKSLIGGDPAEEDGAGSPSPACGERVGVRGSLHKV